MNINRVILAGTLTKDPTFRFNPKGELVCSAFTICTEDKWIDKEGRKQERAHWHQVETFGKPAALVQKWCSGGKLVYLEGLLRNEEWVDKDDIKRSKTVIRVDGINSRLVLLGKRDDDA